MHLPDPDKAGLFHIVGIGGIGMSAIAEVMHTRGYQVQGSDLKDGANLERLARPRHPLPDRPRPRQYRRRRPISSSRAR